MQERIFQLERYAEQLRQTIRTQSSEMKREKERLAQLSKEYDEKMKGYQDSLAQLQVMHEERRVIQEEISRKEVAIAQATSQAEVAENYQAHSYDRKMSTDGGFKYQQQH